MPQKKTTTTAVRQVARPFNAAHVVAQFKQASEQLFRRRLHADVPALPGLEVSESSWAEWERVFNSDQR